MIAASQKRSIKSSCIFLRGIFHLIKWRGRKASPETDSLGVWRNFQEVCVFKIQKLRAQGKMEITQYGKMAGGTGYLELL
jgi:hypothetical protein